MHENSKIPLPFFPVWSTEDGSMDVQRLKILDTFLCATLFGIDENHGSCSPACVFLDNGLVVVHDSSAGYLGPFGFISVHKYSKVVDTVIL